MDDPSFKEHFSTPLRPHTSLLTIAIVCEQLTIADLILDSKVYIDAETIGIALHLALGLEFVDLANKILETREVSQIVKDSMLHTAMKGKNIDILKTLAKNGKKMTDEDFLYAFDHNGISGDLLRYCLDELKLSLPQNTAAVFRVIAETDVATLRYFLEEKKISVDRSLIEICLRGLELSPTVDLYLKDYLKRTEKKRKFCEG